MTLALWPHQKEALIKIRERNGAAGLFMDMRTGKTRPALVSCAVDNRRRVLVVCPSIACSVWEDEAKIVHSNMTDQSRRLPVIDLTLYGTVAERANKVKLLRDTDAILLINYESYWREPLRAAILAWRPDAVILDEAQRIKGRGSRQARFAHHLADRSFVKTRLALTGTPSSNGLQDMWSIFRFIDKDIFGSAWKDFRDEYLNMDRFFTHMLDRKNPYNHVDKANSLISSASYQCNRGDVMEQLPSTETMVRVQLTGETKRVYDEMLRFSIAELQAMEGQPKSAIARTALVRTMRLHQISSGFVSDEDGTITHLGDEKTDATVDLIRQAHDDGLKSVVFCRFRADLDMLEAALENKKIRWARIDGDTPVRERTTIRRAFADDKYDTVLCQIRTASLGIDLTSASVGIFHSTGYSLDDFLQARDRLQGSNQTRHVAYYYVQAGAIDGAIYDALRNKVQLAQALTNLRYATELLGG